MAKEVPTEVVKTLGSGEEVALRDPGLNLTWVSASCQHLKLLSFQRTVSVTATILNW